MAYSLTAARSVTGAIDAGDWLAFAGALLGVVLAVGGAIFVERWKKSTELQADLKLIEDALVELEQSLSSLDVPFDADRRVADQKQPVIHSLERLEDARAVLAFAREQTKVTDIALWRGLRSIELDIDARRQMLDQEKGILLGRNVTRRVLEINRSKLVAFAENLLPTVRQTIRALREKRAWTF
ncbi:hypothetical protein [Sphingomonas daechungensis]|uniref:hypothetical protein n=1 Tax=Sphingomonas daechungensis TaxID=1176646 RepID=UPI0031E72D18